mmetsp:Transcript_40155/g.90213  ORF Transcript_40155/g.90213 Transcript_40155/m.90213 type:complete len:300 (+) Transcript_40155:1870-2769(+)
MLPRVPGESTPYLGGHQHIHSSGLLPGQLLSHLPEGLHRRPVGHHPGLQPAVRARLYPNLQSQRLSYQIVLDLDSQGLGTQDPLRRGGRDHGGVGLVRVQENSDVLHLEGLAEVGLLDAGVSLVVTLGADGDCWQPNTRRNTPLLPNKLQVHIYQAQREVVHKFSQHLGSEPQLFSVQLVALHFIHQVLLGLQGLKPGLNASPHLFDDFFGRLGTLRGADHRMHSAYLNHYLPRHQASPRDLYGQKLDFPLYNLHSIHTEGGKKVLLDHQLLQHDVSAPDPHGELLGVNTAHIRGQAGF